MDVPEATNETFEKVANLDLKLVAGLMAALDKVFHNRWKLGGHHVIMKRNKAHLDITKSRANDLAVR